MGGGGKTRQVAGGGPKIGEDKWEKRGEEADRGGKEMQEEGRKGTTVKGRGGKMMGEWRQI